MASLNNTCVIEVRPGKTFKVCVDVLAAAREVLDLIPEWHTEERERLAAKMVSLADSVERNIVSRTL